MSNTSCTTTGLRVGDNETSRTPILKEVADDVLHLGVKAAPAGAANTDSINGGITVGSQIPMIVVKTGAGVKTLEGSFAGDHRAQSSRPDNVARPDMSAFYNPPAPREFTRQTPLSGHSPASAPKVVTECPEVVD